MSESLLKSCSLKRDSGTGEYPVNIAKSLRIPYFIEHLRVAASGKIRSKSLKSAKSQFQLFLATLDITGSLYIVTKQCKM